MAFEVIRGQKYSYPSDVWSFGVCIFLLMSKRFPFDIRYYPKTNTVKILNASWYFDEQVIAKYSEELRDLVTRMFEIDPAKRITVEEIKDLPLLKKYANVTDEQVTASF